MARGGERRGISRRTLLVGGGAGVGLVLAWGLWPRSYRPNLRAGRARPVQRLPQDRQRRPGHRRRAAGRARPGRLDQPAPDPRRRARRRLAHGRGRAGADQPALRQPPARRGARPTAPSAAAASAAGRAAICDPQGADADRAGRPRCAPSSRGCARPARRRARCSARPPRGAGTSTGRRSTRAAASSRRGDDRIALRRAGRGRGGRGAARKSAGPRRDREPARPASRCRGSTFPPRSTARRQFAGDIRLPDMVYASVRAGPAGGSRLARIDRAAAQAVPGVLAIFDEADWSAAVATNWWAADRGARRDAAALRDVPDAPPTSERSTRRSTRRSTADDGTRLFERGDRRRGFAGAARSSAAIMRSGSPPSAPLETLTATARLTGDRLEIWAPTQAPGLARARGRAGRRLRRGPGDALSDAGRRRLRPQARDAGDRPGGDAGAAARSGRSSSIWSRIEESARDGFRPPARGADVGAAGRRRPDPRLAGADRRARTTAPRCERGCAARAARDGADGAPSPARFRLMPSPPSRSIICPPRSASRTGVWRSGAHSYTAFFTESFIDELARLAGRRAALVPDADARRQSAPRALPVDRRRARRLGRRPVRQRDGHRRAQRLRIAYRHPGRGRGRRASSGCGCCARVCAVDCGRVVNPEIVRQQIEGGIVFGIAAATGNADRLESGRPDALGLRRLRLPGPRRLARGHASRCSRATRSRAGSPSSAVPTAAPAIANAVFALTGRRLRDLPLAIGAADDAAARPSRRFRRRRSACC